MTESNFPIFIFSLFSLEPSKSEKNARTLPRNGLNSDGYDATCPMSLQFTDVGTIKGLETPAALGARVDCLLIRQQLTIEMT